MVKHLPNPNGMPGCRTLRVINGYPQGLEAHCPISPSSYLFRVSVILPNLNIDDTQESIDWKLYESILSNIGKYLRCDTYEITMCDGRSALFSSCRLAMDEILSSEWEWRLPFRRVDFWAGPKIECVGTCEYWCEYGGRVDPFTDSYTLVFYSDQDRSAALGSIIRDSARCCGWFVESLIDGEPIPRDLGWRSRLWLKLRCLLSWH